MPEGELDNSPLSQQLLIIQKFYNRVYVIPKIKEGTTREQWDKFRTYVNSHINSSNDDQRELVTCWFVVLFLIECLVGDQITSTAENAASLGQLKSLLSERTGLH